MIDTENRVHEWDFQLRRMPGDAITPAVDERPLSLFGPGTWVGLVAGAAFGFLKVPLYLQQTLQWSEEACKAFGLAAALALGSMGAVLGCVAWHSALGSVRRLLGKDGAKPR